MVKNWTTSQMAILKIGWAQYGPFSNIFLYTPGAASSGAPRALPRPGKGYFSKLVWKLTIFGSSYFQNRNLASFFKIAPKNRGRELPVLSEQYSWVPALWLPGPFGNPTNLQWLTFGKPTSRKDSHNEGRPWTGPPLLWEVAEVPLLYGVWPYPGEPRRVARIH